jgi:hypothetical protein
MRTSHTSRFPFMGSFHDAEMVYVHFVFLSPADLIFPRFHGGVKRLKFRSQPNITNITLRVIYNYRGVFLTNVHFIQLLDLKLESIESNELLQFESSSSMAQRLELILCLLLRWSLQAQLESFQHCIRHKQLDHSPSLFVVGCIMRVVIIYFALSPSRRVKPNTH